MIDEELSYDALGAPAPYVVPWLEQNLGCEWDVYEKVLTPNKRIVIAQRKTTKVAMRLDDTRRNASISVSNTETLAIAIGTSVIGSLIVSRLLGFHGFRAQGAAALIGAILGAAYGIPSGQYHARRFTKRLQEFSPLQGISHR